MATFRRLALGGTALLAVISCGNPENEDDKGERKRGALTSSLFLPYVAYPTGSMPEAVAIGDLDGDGRNDVALLTSTYFDAANDYMVHVFLQDVDGSLKPRVKYSVGLRGRSIDVGDVNGDGRADVVVGLAGGSPIEIGVLLQNASGTLDPKVSYPTANAAQVKIGDVNGDGRLDVVGISDATNSDTIDVLLQTETGTLAAPVTYHAPHGYGGEVDAADVDGDGRTDVVVMSGQRGLPSASVLLQLAGGTLGPPASYVVGGDVEARGIAVGDTSGDGRADIVVGYGGNSPNAFIARLLQNAQGTMDAAVSYRSLDIPTSVVLADVDADGRKDVLLTHSGWGNLGVFRQYPGGALVTEELYRIGSASWYTPQGLAVGDINSDGRPDAVVADSLGGLLVLRHVADTSLGLAVASPAAGGIHAVGYALPIRWAVGDTAAVASFDVELSTNYGGTYSPLAGCTGLPATARECVWASPGPAQSAARLRVTARTPSGEAVSAESIFTLSAPFVAVQAQSTEYVGWPTAIRWQTNLPATGAVKIELLRGSAIETLASAAPNTGSFSWTVTGPAAGIDRIGVTYIGPGSSVFGGGNEFAIRIPVISVTAPTAGAIFPTAPIGVAWTDNIVSATSVRIEVSHDGGSTFQTVNAAASSGATGGGINVSSPGADTNNAIVRVTTNGPVTLSAQSAPFTILTPKVTLTNPAAGSTVVVGTPLSIAWSTTIPASEPMTIHLSRDGGLSYEVLVNKGPNTGSFLWTVTGPTTTAARLRFITGGSWSTVFVGDPFTIAAPSLTVTGPTTPVYAGGPATVTWTHNLPASDSVRVELTRDSGSSYELLAAAAPNTGSFLWNASGPDSASASVRVTSNGTGASGTSGGFPIVVPALTVVTPAAGTTVFGPWLSVEWTSNVPSAGTVALELSRDGGASYQVVDAAVPSGAAGGSWSGMVFGADTSAARVRVTTSGAVAVSGTSGSFAMLTPALAVTSPAAGATFYSGAPMSVVWLSNLPASAVAKVELSRDGGSSFETLADAAPNTGSFASTTTSPGTADARVRVTLTAGPGIVIGASSAAFAIVTSALTVTAPAAGAVVRTGTAATIAWTSNLPAGDTVAIALSRDGGGSYETLATAAPNTGSFAWTAVGPDAAEARVRVTGNGSVSASGVGGAFAIVTGAVTVTSPSGAASWAIGTARTISWTSSNIPAGTTVRVELSRNGGGSWTTLAASAAATGSLPWTASAPATTTAVVRVSANGSLPAVGTSGLFTIGSPTLAVTSPAAGASWVIGTAQTITWTSNLLPTTTVKVQVSRNGGSTYTALASSAPNTGSYAWTASGAATTTALVRVVANGISASGASGQFSLVAGAVAVTAPNTAVTWSINSTKTITWTHNAGAGAQFKIEVSRSGTWSVLAASAPATGATSGSYDWTVSGPTTTNAKVRVTWNANTAAKDTSDVAFKIAN
jgi:hypothetical protein